MLIHIKKILTEDSELMQSVRASLSDGLVQADQAGKALRAQTGTKDPGAYDQPKPQEKKYLKDNSGTEKEPEDAIEESIIQARNEYLGTATLSNKGAAAELSKAGLANVERGAKTVAAGQARHAAGLQPKPKVSENLEESDFGKAPGIQEYNKLTGHKSATALEKTAVSDRAKQRVEQSGLDNSHFNTARGPGHLDKPGVAINKIKQLSDEQIARRLKYKGQ